MSKDFWENLPRPIVALAPMDGYTDTAFRQVVRSINPGVVVFTEFTSADGLHFAREKLSRRFDFDPAEQPVVAQIFGNNPETFIEAAKFCEERGFSGIDINMGCPAKQVVKSEQGVALRKWPDLAFRLIEAVATNTALPVSVKTRLGWSNADDLVSFGKGVEEAGANLLTIHGRTYSVPYTCPADFEPIYALQSELSIPVLGNGGITSLADGKAKLGNLAGFMIGQASLGNPWVFAETEPENFPERIPLIRRHVRLMLAHADFAHTTLELRKHLIAYTKRIPNAANYRSRLAQVKSPEDIETILTEMELQM